MHMQIIKLHNKNEDAYEEELKNAPKKNCCVRFVKFVKEMFRA